MRTTKNNERASIRLDINNPDHSISIMGVFQIAVFGVVFAGLFWVWLTDTIDILKRK